jgi:arginine exporter protein ArgO
MVILGLVFLLFIFFFGVMFMMALGSQNLKETLEEEAASKAQEEERRD